MGISVRQATRADAPAACDAIRRSITTLLACYERTGDQPFDRIEAVISAQELAALSERYKQIAGYDTRSLQA